MDNFHCQNLFHGFRREGEKPAAGASAPGCGAADGVFALEAENKFIVKGAGTGAKTGQRLLEKLPGARQYGSGLPGHLGYRSRECSQKAV